MCQVVVEPGSANFQATRLARPRFKNFPHAGRSARNCRGSRRVQQMQLITLNAVA